MDKTAYKPKLLSLLQTKNDLLILEEKLDRLETLLGSPNQTNEQKLKIELDYISFNAVIQDLQMLELNINSQSDIQSYLTLISDKASELKLLKLNLAIIPTKETVEEIYFWITQNLGSNILIDITTNKTLIAGAELEFEGKFKDYSFKNKLDYFFKNNLNSTTHE